MRWEYLQHKETGAVLHIRRSVWYGKTVTTKTESSEDDVPIGDVCLSFIEAYRDSISGKKEKPTEGFMFGYGPEDPIDLHSYARWQIKPVLEACVHCGEQSKRHTAETGHQYQRDESLPAWKWKLMRSGNATFLNENFEDDGSEVASLMLRHSGPAVTLAHYIKRTRQQKRAYEAAKAAEEKKVVLMTKRAGAAALDAVLSRKTANQTSIGLR